MRSNRFCRNVLKKLFTKKGRPKPPLWYTPGNKREKPGGHGTQYGTGPRCWGLGPCGYDPAKCEGRSNESIPSLRSAGCVRLEHIVPGPRRYFFLRSRITIAAINASNVVIQAINIIIIFLITLI